MITETTKRAGYSRIAKQLREVFSPEANISVSENAPCRSPKYYGWEEVEKKENWIETVDYLLKNNVFGTQIHIKTATLGGRSRIWIWINN